MSKGPFTWQLKSENFYGDLKMQTIENWVSKSKLKKKTIPLSSLCKLQKREFMKVMIIITGTYFVFSL